MNILMDINMGQEDADKIINKECVDEWGMATVWVNDKGYELNLCFDQENASAWYKMQHYDDDTEETDSSDFITCTVDFTANDWKMQMYKEMARLAIENLLEEVA